MFVRTSFQRIDRSSTKVSSITEKNMIEIWECFPRTSVGKFDRVSERMHVSSPIPIHAKNPRNVFCLSTPRVMFTRAENLITSGSIVNEQDRVTFKERICVFLLQSVYS
jgi:hypothetical protein